MFIDSRSRYCLVLGAAGFIGRHVARVLSSNNFVVLGLGHGSLSNNDLSEWGITEWLSADISLQSLDLLVKDRQIYSVIHCAGSGTVSFSYSNPNEDFERAVSSTSIALEWIRIKGWTNCRFIFLSSAAVYGNENSTALKEDSLLRPCSPYGHHKLMAEILSKSYSLSFKIPCTIVRPFSVYGEGLCKQLLWDAMLKFNEGNPVFWGTGYEVRDWIHVCDLAALILKIVVNDQGLCNTYNAGSEASTVSNLLHTLAEFSNSNQKISFNGSINEGSPFSLRAHPSRAETALGWKATVPLDLGLKAYAKWFNLYYCRA